MQAIPNEVFNAFKNNRGQIVDQVSYMPSIGIDAIKAGADKVLATLYLIRALREDLYSQKRNRINIANTITGVPRERSALDTSSLFFYQQHRLLRSLLVDTIIKGNNTKVWDMLNRNGADVWKDEKGDWMFKCSETQFLCRVA